MKKKTKHNQRYVAQSTLEIAFLLSVVFEFKKPKYMYFFLKFNLVLENLIYEAISTEKESTVKKLQ